MPIFWSRSTRIQLSTTSLESISSCPPANESRSTSITTHGIAGTSILSEDLFPHGDNGDLRFLGAHEDMPFFLVRVGNGLIPFADKMTGGGWSLDFPSSVLSEHPSTSLGFTHPTSRDAVEYQTACVDQSGEQVSASRTHSTFGRPIRRPKSLDTSTSELERASASPVKASPVRLPSVPVPASTKQPGYTQLPLTLTVSLSASSFIRSFDARAKPLDIHIAVFLNGEFTASRIVPARVISGTTEISELTQTFSGRRVGRTRALKWALLPLGLSPDCTRLSPTSLKPGERWARISAELDLEADRWGKDGHGERALVGEYLDSLAKIKIPAEVEHAQGVGSLGFGIVDVVIILGKGKKEPATYPYLKEPQRALDPRCFEESHFPDLQVLRTRASSSKESAQLINSNDILSPLTVLNH